MNRYRLGALLMAPMTSLPAIVAAQVSPDMPSDPGISVAEWLISLAILLVLILGGMAWTRRISWAWCIGAIFGLVIAFGLPQVVSWFKATFAG